MFWDLLFRLVLAGAAITGCALFFKVKAAWVRQCHLVLGLLAVVLCLITFFIQYF
jgi:hypothetical protein